MNIGIIGSGGREHSLCYKLKESSLVDKIFCFPGNAGTETIAKNINIDILDFEKIKITCEENNIELIVVGPEKPLVDGIVEYFKKTKIKVLVDIKKGLNELTTSSKENKRGQPFNKNRNSTSIT